MTLYNHEYWMEKAIQLAQKGRYTTHPNPRVGCVLVKSDQLIGQGFHLKAGDAHAEVNALNDAKKNSQDVKGATAYVTLEPCSHQGKTPPCADALIKAGVARVVFGMQDPNPEVSGRGLAKIKKVGEQYRGKPYDLLFDWSDEKIYCSELVWKIYKEALGIELGKLQQLKDFDLSHPTVQKKLGERYGNHPPLNATVISPENIFSSSELEEVVRE